MTPARRALACAAAVVLFLTLALVSTLRSFGDTWSFLTDQREGYADLTADNRNVVPEFQGLIPVSAQSFLFDHLRRDDRYYVQVQPGTFFTGVDLPTAVRTFARFSLLPAVAVTDPADADVVISFGADPRQLGLRYSSIARADDGRTVVARVREHR
jgi:hypothetical protein